METPAVDRPNRSTALGQPREGLAQVRAPAPESPWPARTSVDAVFPQFLVREMAAPAADHRFVV
jgi:hypothetical protein